MHTFRKVPIMSNAIPYGLGEFSLKKIRKLIAQGNKEGVAFVLSKSAYLEKKETGIRRIVIEAKPNHLFINNIKSFRWTSMKSFY